MRTTDLSPSLGPRAASSPFRPCLSSVTLRHIPPCDTFTHSYSLRRLRPSSFLLPSPLRHLSPCDTFAILSLRFLRPHTSLTTSSSTFAYATSVISAIPSLDCSHLRSVLRSTFATAIFSPFVSSRTRDRIRTKQACIVYYSMRLLASLPLP